MSDSVVAKIKTGAAALLFLLFALAAAPAARADFSDFFFVPDDVGAAKIPRFGASRVLVVAIAQSPSPAPPERLRLFFSVDAPAPSFRDYWRAVSLSQYDPRPETVGWTAAPEDIPSQPPTFDDGCPWRELVSGALRSLADSRAYIPAEFDINGLEGMPDGFLDGLVIIADGVEGARAFPGDALPNVMLGAVAPGPFVIAGPDASEYEILRAFAQTLGFAELGAGADGRGGIVLSLMGLPEKGIPLIDAYSRLRAGWAKPIALADPPRLYFILPALEAGEVYVAGGPREFFLIENRAPSSGYDSALSGPGLAIFHIDETKLAPPGAPPSDGDSVWRPLVMNKWPDASFPPQKGLPARSDDALFREPHSVKSDYSSQNALSDKRHPLNSNFHSGEPSDFVLRDINCAAHFPMITVTAGME